MHGAFAARVFGYYWVGLCLLSATVHAAVSLANPSFEDSATWQNSGWLQTHVGTGETDPQIVENSHPFYGDTPFGQRYVLMLHPIIGNAALNYVSGFEVGQQYELSFWAAASTSDSVVQAGGLIGVQDTVMPHFFLYNFPVTASRNSEFSDWYKFTISFTAPSDVMTLYIGQSGQGFGPVYFPPIAVDQISIADVPEPGLLALTVCALFIAKRRRCRA